MPTPNPPAEGDPRVYLAAERTLLAWLRTGIALMGFGFVIARFGVFLREFFLHARGEAQDGSGRSLTIGLLLVAAGIVLCVGATIRHSRILRALDEGTFRSRFDSWPAWLLVATLVLAGAGMMLLLVWL